MSLGIVDSDDVMSEYITIIIILYRMVKVGLTLRNMKGLEELRKLAADKQQWEETCN